MIKYGWVHVRGTDEVDIIYRMKFDVGCVYYVTITPNLALHLNSLHTHARLIVVL